MNGRETIAAIVAIVILNLLYMLPAIIESVKQ